MKYLLEDTLKKLVRLVRLPDKNGLEAVLDEVKNCDFNTLRVQTIAAPGDASATAVHVAANLGVAAQNLTTLITPIDAARLLTVTGGISGQTGNVVITGTDINGTAQVDTIALSGTSTVPGVMAFKTVTNIHLPIQTHTAAAQVETATGVGTVSNPGDAAVIVTAAGMAGSPKTYACPVTNGDPSHWMPEILAVLAADLPLTTMYNVAAGATPNKITLTRIAPAADDGTLNISIATGTATGITTAASSANTTTGVAYDTVSVGTANKFGAAFPLTKAGCFMSIFGTALEATVPTQTLDASVGKSLFAPAGTPDGGKNFIFYYYL